LATKNRSEARGTARHDVQSKLVVEVIKRKHRDGDADALRAGDFKEVRSMRDGFGASYDSYARRVNALVPWPPDG